MIYFICINIPFIFSHQHCVYYPYSLLWWFRFQRAMEIETWSCMTLLNYSKTWVSAFAQDDLRCTAGPNFPDLCTQTLIRPSGDEWNFFVDQNILNMKENKNPERYSWECNLFFILIKSCGLLKKCFKQMAKTSEVKIFKTHNEKKEMAQN